MHRPYTVAGVAVAISDKNEAEDSETECMLLMQNEQEEESEIEEVMSDIEEEVSAVDFVDEAREPEQTKDVFNEDNKDFGMPFVSPSGKRWVETVPAHSGRRRIANILRQKGEITAYATHRSHDIVCSFKCIFDQSMLDTIIVEINRGGRRVKGNEWKDVASMEIETYFGLCILRGVFKDNNENVRELWIPVSGRPIFGNTMVFNRLEDIRRMLRFDNRATRMARLRNDPMAATRLLLDGLVTNSQKCCIHNECMTVDEELYPFRGRCLYIQYMPC